MISLMKCCEIDYDIVVKRNIYNLYFKEKFVRWFFGNDNVEL